MFYLEILETHTDSETYFPITHKQNNILPGYVKFNFDINCKVIIYEEKLRSHRIYTT